MLWPMFGTIVLVFYGVLHAGSLAALLAVAVTPNNCVAPAPLKLKKLEDPDSTSAAVSPTDGDDRGSAWDRIRRQRNE
jgi:hypothetical protein